VIRKRKSTVCHIGEISRYQHCAWDRNNRRKIESELHAALIAEACTVLQYISLAGDYQFDKSHVRNTARHETRYRGVRGKLTAITQRGGGGREGGGSAKVFRMIKQDRATFTGGTRKKTLGKLGLIPRVTKTKPPLTVSTRSAGLVPDRRGHV